MQGSPAWRVIEVPAGERQGYMALLRLADDSETEVARYCNEGVLFGLIDGVTGELRGEVLVVAAELGAMELCGVTGDLGESGHGAAAELGAMELRSVAIDPAWQGRGMGRALVQEVLARLRARGVQRVVVATAMHQTCARTASQCGMRSGWSERWSEGAPLAGACIGEAASFRPCEARAHR
jgi:GNAT superfamily N-acetyltransferase